LPSKLKESTINNLCKIKEMTSAACAKDGFGCCSNFFCGIAKLEAEALGYTPVAVSDDIPYLGKDGACVIPPEFRPGCSMYVCPEHLEDRKFRRCWEKHRKKILSDPVIKDKITNNQEVNDKLQELINNPELAARLD